jgi:acyl carrier protein
MQPRDKNRILRIIAENSGINESSIELTHSIVTDLHCDSLDRIEIALALEEEFGIGIDEVDFVKCLTVQQIIDHVADVCTAQKAQAINCTSHHLSCPCREQRIATLQKACLDAIMELDWLKKEASLPKDKNNAITALVERGHDAIQTLNSPSTQQPTLRVVA